MQVIEHVRNLKDALDDRGCAEHEVERAVSFACRLLGVDKDSDRRGVDELRRAEIDNQVSAVRERLVQGVVKLGGAAEIVFASEDDLGEPRSRRTDVSSR